MERRTYSVEEAGKMLGISRASAYVAAYRGDLPVLRVGRRLVVPREAFERFLASAYQAPSAAAAEGVHR